MSMQSFCYMSVTYIFLFDIIGKVYVVYEFHYHYMIMNINVNEYHYIYLNDFNKLGYFLFYIVYL